MAKSSEQNTESGKSKRAKNLIPWKPGQSGNPKGYPKGQRQYRTIYKEALRRIAEAGGFEPGEIEDAMTVKAIEKAIKGDYFFYKDIHDRIHGKATETIDLPDETKRSLADLIALAHGGQKPRTRSKPSSTKNKKRA